jgi:hypothetical protein
MKMLNNFVICRPGETGTFREHVESVARLKNWIWILIPAAIFQFPLKAHLTAIAYMIGVGGNLV